MNSPVERGQPAPAGRAGSETRSIAQWVVFLLVALLFLGGPGYLIYTEFFRSSVSEQDAISGPPKPMAGRATSQPASQPAQPNWRTTLGRQMPRRMPTTGMANQQPLLRALQMGNYDQALTLLDEGANVNVVSADPRQTTPLIEACGRPEDEAFDVVQVLIGKGADVNRSQANGLTPLMRAVRSASPLTAGTLILHGANVNAVSRRGDTALDVATQTGQTELIASLQKAGGKTGAAMAPPKPTRPATRPAAKPATRPSTRSATRPSMSPA